MTAPSLAELAAKLTKAQREALGVLPLPYDADPVRWIEARPYGSTWRKATKHRAVLDSLCQLGIVQSTRSRGETLFRLTKPLGLALRAHLIAQEDQHD